MKKTMAFLIGLIAVLVIGGSVYAGNQMARSNAIGETAAQNFALVDAGVSPDDANFIRTEFEREDGRFVYDIKFYANGITYEYTIDSQNGWILAKEQEGTKKTTTQKASLTPAPVATPAPTAAPKPVKAAGISLERAKELALADAGVTADQVTFSKAKLEADDGVQIYDLEFYIDGQHEYDYEIAAEDGTVVGRSVEAWEADDDYVQPAQQTQATQPTQQTNQQATQAKQQTQQSQKVTTPAPQKQQTQQTQKVATPAPQKQQTQKVATPAPQKQKKQQQAAPKKVYYDDDDDDWDDDPDYDDRDDDRDDDDRDDDDDD